MSMQPSLEVMALEPTGAVLKKAGPLRNVRFVAKPTVAKGIKRLAVARLVDLDERPAELRLLVRSPSGLRMPLVLMGLGRRMSLSGFRLLVLLASRFAGTRDAPYVAGDVNTVRRIIGAHAMGAERQLIASASVEDGMLSVWSCEPRLYQCAVSDIPPLARLSGSRVRAVQVSRSGSRLHWDDGDVDLDLDAIRQHADPEIRKAAEAKYRSDVIQYGKAIRKLREESGLRQNQIPGLSDREVRRLEQGEVLPHSGTLQKLAKAHGHTVEAYMHALAALSRRRPSGRKRAYAARKKSENAKSSSSGDPHAAADP